MRSMKRSLIVCLPVLALALLSAGSLSAQNAPQRAPAYATAPNIPYDSVPNFLKLPAGLYLGEGIGVARNSKGNVFVYTRSGESSRLFEFDPTGNFVREIGRGSYGMQMAHAVRVDPQDNIWVVDEGTDTVMKFNPQGRIVMVLGRRQESVEGLALHAGPRFRAAAGGTIHVWPCNGYRLGCRGEYFPFRWLRQFTRREI